MPATTGQQPRSARLPRPGPHNLQLLRALTEHPDYAALRSDPDYFLTEAGGLHSPLLIPGLEEAIELLQATAESRGRILVLGDRDVDGVSSTALLGDFLRDVHQGPLELVVSDEGDDYGLSGALFERIRDGEAELVFLLDMGSSHGPEIAELTKRGKRVIILDHHQLHAEERVPDAAHPQIAFVNPLRDPDLAAEHDGKIATVGLVFKFLTGFALSHTREWKQRFYFESPQGILVYRAGGLEGVFPDLESARASLESASGVPQAAARDAAPTLEAGLKQYALSNEELARLRRNPADGGRVLLARMISSRPRLLEFVRKHADLAAVGIITDMVPLVDENRAVVRLGVGLAGFASKQGRRSYRPGYQALLEALKIPSERLVSRDLGWSVGPALNAAGRMGKTRLALDLLTCREPENARELARELVALNEERKKRTRRNEAIVERHLADDPARTQQALVFCYHPDLEPGVSGIVATRLTERYERPVVYVNPDGDRARGSARSWNGLNMLDLLDSAADLFLQFGGHAEAAGFSIAYENVPLLEERLQKGCKQLVAKAAIEAARQKVKAGGGLLDAGATGGDGLVPPGRDGRSVSGYHVQLRPEELGPRLLRELELLEPFGAHNPEPILRIANVAIQEPKFMTEGLHVRFRVSDAPPQVDFVAWRQGPRAEEALRTDARVDLYGCLEMSYFAGRARLQFRVDRLEIL